MSLDQRYLILEHVDLYATVGCHPTRSAEFDNFGSCPEGYLSALDQVIANNLEGDGRVVAVGECGLGNSPLVHPIFPIS